ncbi:MAG TPA: PilZ domain-containing protein [Candidatus Omnitrophota bacterium]|mgnify:CR=1 FL=1|nr:PilZ domain-containing protein [Candidatus Omnitrophota bacterium]HPN88305.1 PilZ domain-containing protein [Candidatus Omnitrophota bacterium]
MNANINRLDQRLFERFPARFPAKFKDTREDFGSTVQLRDASAEGARIVSKERVYLNDSLSLEVELPDGHAPMTLRGQVVWVKNNTESWDVGLKFFKTSLMPLSRLYKFVAPSLA